MTKYVLAKDLPYAKKGSKVYPSLVFAHELCVTDNDNKERFVLYNDKCFVDIAIEQGWIKEVKPREWALHLDNSGAVWKVTNEKDEMAFCIYPNNGFGRTIKVREVIE